MKKEIKISYDELVVGLLLKFGSIDVNDILVAMDMMGIKNFVSVNDSGIGKYIKRNDKNRYVFDMDMVNICYEMVEDFYVVVRYFQGDVVRKFLENVDIFEFVLRKIKVIGKVSLNKYDVCFSEFQQYVINELKVKRFLTYCYDDKDEGKYTKITARGNLYLFMIDNKGLVNNFCNELRDMGYDDTLIDAFLIVKNLDGDIDDIRKSILNVESFLEFCDFYELNPYGNKGDVKNNEYMKVRKL